jgi:hypothetical protein
MHFIIECPIDIIDIHINFAQLLLRHRNEPIATGICFTV